jgi:hypothetical protein
MVAQPVKKFSAFKEIGRDSAHWILLDQEGSSEQQFENFTNYIDSIRVRFNSVTTYMLPD